MNKTPRYQLTRWGEYYASWGNTEQEVIDRQTEYTNRPWWWLRLLGWNVKYECIPGGFIQHPPEGHPQ